MTREEFEKIVQESIDSLPDEFIKALDNVEIMVKEWPTREQGLLYGLYQGVAKTRRGNYAAATPDMITIFAGPILMHFGHDPGALKNQIRKTVLHEIGHHLGLSDEEIYKAQS